MKSVTAHLATSYLVKVETFQSLITARFSEVICSHRRIFSIPLQLKRLQWADRLQKKQLSELLPPAGYRPRENLYTS